MPEKQSGHSGRIGLKREGQHLEHELDLLSAILRDPCGRVIARIRGGETLGLFNVLFNFSNARQVLIELVAIGADQRSVHVAGFSENKIEDGSLFLLAFLEVGAALTSWTGTE